RTQPEVGLGRCGGPTRCVTSFSRMARRICSPACPVSSSTCACISAHTSAIGNGTRTSNSCSPTTSSLGLDLRSFLWYLFLTAALSFKKGFSTRTLTEFGREPLLLVLKFQLNAGHPRRVLAIGLIGSATKVRL